MLLKEAPFLLLLIIYTVVQELHFAFKCNSTLPKEAPIFTFTYHLHYNSVASKEAPIFTFTYHLHYSSVASKEAPIFTFTYHLHCSSVLLW